jgi:hypothetical protein
LLLETQKLAMDLRNWPNSHALDDVLSVCSFDDDGIVEGGVSSLAASQLLKHDERVPLVDADAFVDDAKKERKASRSKIRSSSAIKQQPPVPSSTAAVVTVAAPSKPLKWQVSSEGCSCVAKIGSMAVLNRSGALLAAATHRCCHSSCLIAARAPSA